MRRTVSKSILLLLCVAAGCSGQRYYADAEGALKTEGYYHALDHILAYYPSGVALNFPGYIVGFEISPWPSVSRADTDLVLDDTALASGYTTKRLIKTLNFELPYVSQIMRYRGRTYGDGNCALYNLYNNSGTAVIEPCPGAAHMVDADQHEYRTTFANSWQAIDLLKAQLAADLESHDYTHLVVAVMGLDTPQEEAVRNYKSIVASIRRSAGESFEPLFVGITWPSFFANRWLDPLWESLAYSTIADRADILGLTWLGVLLNEAVLPLGDRIETVVIGHSFGARAASMGICVGPIISRAPGTASRHPRPARVDRFIGLAPAFSLKRFAHVENIFYQDIHYRDYCPPVNQFVFTASANDSAFSPVFWSDTAGDHDNMVGFCRRRHPVAVSCSDANAAGEPGAYDPAAKIVYFDTSALMKYTVPGGKGTGHSDIFRPETGNFLWRVIAGSDD